MKDIIETIAQLRLQRNWSGYALAKKAGIPQSTLSTWYRKGQTPTIATLEKICKGFGITLSQFFAGNEDAAALTAGQKELLDGWRALNEQKRQAVMDLIRACAQP